MRTALAVLLALGTFSLLFADGYSPEETVKRLKVADGFELTLIAGEPLIRQPVTISFDDRGRLWVLQYLQYPKPAGLTPVHVDKYLRTKYDRVPEPPPHGPKGKDRITILYDRDENGRFRKAKDFVTGLNLASGMALAGDGVYVAQPPYLLFYPDRNHDDIPDGDPEVLLKGFGMEDAHAFANSLQWGPDGWLYGAHGSTAYANIRGISFVQGIWRYHPVTKEFELFSEGGGNTWGLDFDRQGNAIAGTNFGGRAMLHQLQGAYYIKNFVKHGALKNPHAYGYFDHVPYRGFKGGHVTCGGIVYQGGALPDYLENQYIAANPLSSAIHWHRMTKFRSTYKAEHGGVLVDGSPDKWFRPIDCIVGPDGGVYIADWYDKRITHHDPRDNWDRRNGRVYRLHVKGAKTYDPFDLQKRSNAQLVQLLRHRNVWFRRQARRILSERKAKDMMPTLEQMVFGERGQTALEAFWALNGVGGFTDAVAVRALSHPTEEVRTWAVRLLGDRRRVTREQSNRLAEMAREDPSPLVRSQLACTARRLPGDAAVAIVRELILRREDVDDPFIPLLIWWAIEQHAVSDRDRLVRLFQERKVLDAPIAKQYLISRIGRRYMAEGTDRGLRTCAKLLSNVSDLPTQRLLLAGMEQALTGKHYARVPRELAERLALLAEKSPHDLRLLRVRAKLGDPTAYRQVLARAKDPKLTAQERIRLIETLGALQRGDALPVLIGLFSTPGPTAIRQAALDAMQRFDSPRVGESVLAAYPKLSGSLRSRARAMLLGRENTALRLIQAVDEKKLAKDEFSIDELRQIYTFENEKLRKLITKHWGRITPATADDKKGRLRHYARIFGWGKGDPARGYVIFKKTCAVCHKLFGEGNDVGPDLTTANRSDRNYLLYHIVDPSAFQRVEYANYIVATKDGRILTGVIKASSAESITLVNAKNERFVISRSDIEEISPSPTSLMPERLLEPLSDQEFLDLFAYLQAKAPPKR